LVGSAITEIGAPPAVPVPDDRDSQFPVLDAEAVNDAEELGEVVTERFCEGGTLEFTELKVKEEGVATKLNGGGMTVRFTVTVSGELEAVVKTLTVPE
jgi:hypothetical protein